MWLLQTQAYHLLKLPQEALTRLSQAVHLGAPEGYIRRFVDEGPLIAALLSQLREQEHREEDLPYLETLVRAFRQQLVPQPPRLEREPSPILLDPLSAREQDVLHLLARGASNQKIAETLVIAIDTVKRHVSNILTKLDVTNHTQAVARARMLGLLANEARSFSDSKDKRKIVVSFVSACSETSLLATRCLHSFVARSSETFARRLRTGGQ